MNQSAVQLAHDNGHERTIGALTKPDTVEKGDFHQWAAILRGQTHPVKHGYFVTKQPSQSSLDLGIDGTQARIEEENFFRNESPWKDEYRDLSNRFGTNNLANFLSRELGRLIREQLPEICDKIKEQKSAVEEHLSQLPAPPSENQLLTVHRLLANFYADYLRHLTGTHGMNTFKQILRRTSEELFKKLGTFKPRLVVLDSASSEEAELREYRLNGGNIRIGAGADSFARGRTPGSTESTPTKSRQLPATPNRKRPGDPAVDGSTGKRTRPLQEFQSGKQSSGMDSGGMPFLMSP